MWTLGPRHSESLLTWTGFLNRSVFWSRLFPVATSCYATRCFLLAVPCQLRAHSWLGMPFVHTWHLVISRKLSRDQVRVKTARQTQTWFTVLGPTTNDGPGLCGPDICHLPDQRRSRHGVAHILIWCQPKSGPITWNWFVKIVFENRKLKISLTA